MENFQMMLLFQQVSDLPLRISIHALLVRLAGGAVGGSGERQVTGGGVLGGGVLGEGGVLGGGGQGGDVGDGDEQQHQES